MKMDIFVLCLIFAVMITHILNIKYSVSYSENQVNFGGVYIHDSFDLCVYKFMYSLNL